MEIKIYTDQPLPLPTYITVHAVRADKVIMHVWSDNNIIFWRYGDLVVLYQPLAHISMEIIYQAHPIDIIVLGYESHNRPIGLRPYTNDYQLHYECYTITPIA